MKLIDMNGNEVRANVSASNFPIRGESSKSMIQQNAGKILVSKYSLYTILEEWPIPGSKLTIDFFIPQLRIAVEVDGSQHKKFNKFFHGTIENFRKQKERDARKKSWCEMNNIDLYSVTDLEQLEELL